MKHSLSVDEQIKNIVDFKFRLVDSVDNFPDLF